MALLDHRISSPSHLSKLLKTSLVRDGGNKSDRADFARHDWDVVDSQEPPRVWNGGEEKAEQGEKQTVPTIRRDNRLGDLVIELLKLRPLVFTVPCNISSVGGRSCALIVRRRIGFEERTL